MPDRMNRPANRITRRAILRGAGVTMTLPWLRSFAAKAGAVGAKHSPSGLEWSFSAVASTRITGDRGSGPR